MLCPSLWSLKPPCYSHCLPAVWRDGGGERERERESARERERESEGGREGETEREREGEREREML